MNETDAIYGFMKWLSSRHENISVGENSATDFHGKLIERFRKANKLPKSSSGWEKNVKFPKNKG
jgi:hypothetical protein